MRPVAVEAAHRRQQVCIFLEQRVQRLLPVIFRH